jgi:hypothetical protein
MPATTIFEQGPPGVWTPNALARGPFEGIQGGALAGLMCAAICDACDGFVASVTTHFLRAAPLASLVVEVKPLRCGRRVGVIDAVLSGPSGVLAVQRATLIRPENGGGLPVPPRRPVDPEGFPRQCRTAPHGQPWLMDAMDLRLSATGVAWLRLNVPIVESDKPVTRVLAAADWAHGLSAPMGAESRPEGVAIPNPDLTVHLIRQPTGDWIGVEPASAWSGAAIGAGWGALYDTEGLIGRVAMSIAVSTIKEPGQ